MLRGKIVGEGARRKVALERRGLHLVQLFHLHFNLLHAPRDRAAGGWELVAAVPTPTLVFVVLPRVFFSIWLAHPLLRLSHRRLGCFPHGGRVEGELEAKRLRPRGRCLHHLLQTRWRIGGSSSRLAVVGFDEVREGIDGLLAQVVRRLVQHAQHLAIPVEPAKLKAALHGLRHQANHPQRHFLGLGRLNIFEQRQQTFGHLRRVHGGDAPVLLLLDDEFRNAERLVYCLCNVIRHFWIRGLMGPSRQLGHGLWAGERDAGLRRELLRVLHACAR